MPILLTDKEMKIVSDPEVLLAKNKIIQKVYKLLGDMAEVYKKEVQSASLVTLQASEPKISRGENYKGLPYVILDYPRVFGKTDVFAIRTFFWWGNFFSITLQLSGKYQEDYLPKIKKAIEEKVFEGWFIGSAPTPWEHHFEKDNYVPLMQEEKLFVNLPHLKISKKIPLKKWDEVESFLKENFRFLINILST